MPTLAELQRAFARGIDGDPSEAGHWIVDDGIDPAARLGIYRNNADAIVAQYLHAAFPAVARLGGAGYLESLAPKYRRQHPSRSGNLHDLGAAFAGFLQELLVTTPYTFMADVARLEWAYQEALVEAEAAVFPREAFAVLPEDAHPRLCFAFAPSVRYVRSAYPVSALWEANRRAESDGATVDLAAGGEQVLMDRAAGGVRLRALGAGEGAMVEAILAGQSLAAVLAAVETVDAACDPVAFLYELIESGRIDRFRLD